MSKLILRIKKVIRKYYISTRLLYSYKFHKDNIGLPPIVIYQMGKVGSTSVLHSLQTSELFPALFQVHTLSKQGIHEMEKRYWGNTPVLFRKSLLPETTHVYISHVLRRHLIKGRAIKWKIITLVRDPIARNVSEFFYSVDTTKDDPHLPDFYQRYRAGNIETTELIDRFLVRFSEESNEYSVPLYWFNREVLNVLDVNVYAYEFPKEKGYQIIKTNEYDILILKLEELKSCYNEALHEFLDLQNPTLLNTNTANQKDYYPAYKDFIQNANLPSQYISKVYASRFVRHFYSQQEIEQFTRKWTKGNASVK